MNKKKLTKVLQRSLVAVVAVVLLFCAVAAPQAEASNYKASYIEQRKDINVNYQDYLDGSVMYRLPDTIRDDQDISVIVTLDIVSLLDAYEQSDKSVSFTDYALLSDEAKEIEGQIAARKAKILAALDEKSISYTNTGLDYSTLLSGFELVIKAGDFEATCKALGDGADVIVGEVYNISETQLVENTVNVYETGIINSANSGYDGSGMVVAVLDTGLDYAHSAFSTSNFTSTNLGLTYEQVAALIGKTTASTQMAGLTVDDVYISEKVPFGFDYADYDADVYSTHNNHGTHVSGVIVGKDDTITGVAPNAQLVSMKVFSDVYDSALSSWILSALEDCVVLGVDVINMSLGTACGFSRESDEEKLNGVYDKIREAGISLIVAASNSYSSAYGSEANGNLPLTSNPDIGTVGSPGTYEGTMSVASINGVETPYILYGETIIYFDEANNNAGKEQDFCEKLLNGQESLEIEFVTIPGVGRSADYAGIDVKGKIALVRRGDNTFEEKAIIAQNQGAAGIIIYNNVSGEIKMNIGDATLAVCSITQDDGEMLAAIGTGKLKFSVDQTSGPFMSDFSSWGPTADLSIKPEITQHGGNILSAVTGGDYDRLSGTSMACPNVAGLTLLLRQYVVENFPEIADDNVQVNAMVYRLMMATADIVINTNGLPYAVRKQGAGLANLMSAINTDAVIVVYDENGKATDKVKLELGDDPAKTGVYTMTFTVENFGSSTLSYDLGAYVLTEGVSDTLTNAGKTTVTEQAYVLSGAAVEYSVSGAACDGGKNLTLEPGKTAAVTVTITLSDADKAYLDASFENGMYVEGFITLTATAGTEVNLSVPYLAFYGDWTLAPMMDKDYFETNADELDDSVAFEDKNMPDAYATRPIGGVEEDYVSYLGTYYFIQNPEDRIISANREYIALSNQEGTIHSLRFVWAGLLRSAAKIEISITDDTTGEVVYETVDTDVRKSYGDGGSIYPAQIEIEFDTMDYNLANNSEYTVTIVGYMDYEDGGVDTNKKNTFTFPLTVDFEAPTVTDVSFRSEYDKTLKKNRLYADIAVYDNHYSMCLQVGYVGTTTDADGNAAYEVKTFEQYFTPVYSQRNGTTVVTYELTDYIYTIKENSVSTNAFVVTAYDYALNYATYEIGLPDDYVDFYFDSFEGGVTLSPNEVYTMEPLVFPDTEWAELLEYRTENKNIVNVVNNKLVAVKSGSTRIKVRDPRTNQSVTFRVTVLAEGDEGYKYYDKPVADVFKLDGYYVSKAYYQLSTEDRDIGSTGDVRYFDGNYSLSLYPSETVALNYTLDAYFPDATTVTFASSNANIVTVNEYGVITGVAEGSATVSVKVLLDGKSTYYSESIFIDVKDPFVVSGPSLTHYFGNGGQVVIPIDLDLTSIGNFAFSNFDYVSKTPEEIEFDDSTLTKQWYLGDNTITKVTIPEGVETIGAYAFANLTALTEVVLPSTLKQIEYGAFYGCTSLQKITFSGENNLVIINQWAFQECDLQGKLDLPAAYVISDYAFAGNKDLKGITLPETLQTIGAYAFAGCESLAEVNITAAKVKYGEYAFNGCDALKTFYVNSALIPEGMFYECENLTSVEIGPDVNAINEYAFRDTALTTYTVCEGNTAFRVQSADYVLSADGKQLVAVAPTARGSFTAENLDGADVTTIGRGAFSHNNRISSVTLENVTVVGDYGFADCERLASVQLGQLTSIGEYGFAATAMTQMPAAASNVQIGKYAFTRSGLTSVTIPDGMVIAEGVFSECMDLESVTIGDNVTIGDHAFYYNNLINYDVGHYVEKGAYYFYYEFSSPLKQLTIGKNAVIGKNAFSNAASLETVTLGENAQIGYMAFYNNESLKNIDLSKAASIGDYAFSGDVYYICTDDNMNYAAVSTTGHYIYTYHAPALQSVDLSSATSIGAYSFAYCRSLTNVKLGETITEIPEYAFAGCEVISNIDLSHVSAVGDYAFMESGIQNVDLSAATSIGEYAFVFCQNLDSLKFSPSGCAIGEGAFSYCEKLTGAENFEFVQEVGPYAFAYTGITNVDLSGATSIGDFAFLKENVTPFTVKLGASLVSLGDNPFAMCAVAPFYTTETVSFNGKEYTTNVYTFNYSDTVYVVDGSLYCKVANDGLELITFAGTDTVNVHLADNTVRISSHAFAGSAVEMVTLPYTVNSIGHKAFYQCDKLGVVVFTSYESPILEEEFDSAYYESLANIPGSGDYGNYTDYEGNEVKIEPIEVIPYFMWNATGGMYSNVFYGANFMDYIGHIDHPILMVRPSNGQNYDSFIYSQYFNLSLTIDGTAAADDNTLAAIAAIAALPERVTLEHKALVEAARAAYNKVATTEQQALVTNYGTLLSAEQRIKALSEPVDPPVVDPVEEPTPDGTLVAVVIIAVIAVAGLIVVILALKNRKKTPKAEKAEEMTEEAPENAPAEAAEVSEVQAEETTQA